MIFSQLQDFLSEKGQPAYRFSQAKDAYCKTFAASWDELTVWPKALRAAAAEAMSWDSFTCEQEWVSKAGDTVKFLLKTHDGSRIETVIMRHKDHRNTVCISSQVGCPMACSFCATGTMGLKRNLTAEEIFDQVLYASRWLKKNEEGAFSADEDMESDDDDQKSLIPRVTNVVYMGMGEPMNNYDTVMKSVRMLNDPEGFGLGARHISISTCGIVPGILRLAKEPEQVNLAISLHSAIPETRSKIMPVNKAYPIEKLMDAVALYVQQTNRKVFFEYLLMKGVNDSMKEADALANLMKKNGSLYHVNLIKYHDTGSFDSTARDGRETFLNRLHTKGVQATLRRSFGEDIAAACGQLVIQAK